MIVSRHDFISQRGDSILEVILAMAVIAMITPFIYSQIIDANETVIDTATLSKITDLENPVLNFVRINQSAWPDTAQIRLSDEELDSISEFPTAGFIDKYSVRGATFSDVYLAIDLGYDALRTNRIAKMIGDNAAVVSADGVAYGDAWAVAAPDFKPGNLIYRISRTTSGQDTSKYLHRAALDGLNVMMRNMSMGANNIYDIGTVVGKSIDAQNLSTVFLETQILDVDSIHFPSGANMAANTSYVGNLRVTGDMTGFRNIYADKINGTRTSVSGNIITDRATVTNALTVGGNFNLRSDSTRTIGAFTAISAGSVSTTFISADEMIFLENFGLTISGELLASSTPPLRIGNWSFPSANAPRFSDFNLTRAQIPSAPSRGEFGPITDSAWRDVRPIDMIGGIVQ